MDDARRVPRATWSAAAYLPNVASFVGADTLRTHVLGSTTARPRRRSWSAMHELVRKAMEEGALGIGSALIYAPALRDDRRADRARRWRRSRREYISHLRSEGDPLARGRGRAHHDRPRGRLPAEIYHLKAAGPRTGRRWTRSSRQIEAARRGGPAISANMYTYTAGATALDAAIPAVGAGRRRHSSGKRLADPDTRAQIAAEMSARRGLGEPLPPGRLARASCSSSSDRTR